MHVFIKPGQRFLSCLVCGALDFDQRRIKMVTGGMAFMDLEWLNQAGDGAICKRCGYVHTFMGNGHQWVASHVVNPDDLPKDPLAPTLPGSEAVRFRPIDGTGSDPG